jgi:magnesium-protoporphyrin IX monomethyl ester (oxidative) cyclase
LPESFDAIFDVGVIGEGEKTFTELLNFYCAGEFYRENFQKIDGLVYFQDNELRKTASRRLIENLDEVPPVDRSAFNIRGITHVVSSRGCPYACAFCSSSHFWGGRNVRYHSAEYVFGELKELIAKYKVSYITFWDDLFVADTNRLRKLVVLMDGEKKLFKNVSISANCRANIVTPELCELMRAAHIKFVTMGLESGSDAVLRTIKGAVNVEQNKRAIDILKRYGFNVQASFIIGNPDETEKDIAATYDFIKNSNLDGGCVNVAIPMPATSYWQHGKDRGLVNEKMDFGKLTVKTKFRALKPEDDFILLTDKVDRGAFVEWGRKIEKTLDAKSARSALSLNFIFSKSAILLAIKNPALAIKRLFYLVAGSLKNLWRG